MAIEIRKAERMRAKLRVGVFGPSGAGKTMSSLKIARGLATAWNKVCVIDTENGSADLYSHVGNYNVITLRAPFHPESYVEAIKAAENAGMEVVVIDSITHEWAGSGGILELADSLGKDAKSSYTVWAKLTPRHNKFIEAILQSGCHVICCGRSKQDYALNQTEKNGRTVSVPEKIGLKAVTREGFDYEMTVSFELAISHYATSTKDRTGLFQDKPEHIIDEKTGEQLRKWNESGAEAPIDVAKLKGKIIHNLERLRLPYKQGTKEEQAELIRNAVAALTDLDVSDDTKLETIVRTLEQYSDPEAAQYVVYKYVMEKREKVQATIPPAPAVAPASAPTSNTSEAPITTTTAAGGSVAA